MTEGRVFNFGAGPAALPESVLLQAQKELLNYQQSGRSILEMSHRSKYFEDINKQTEEDLRKLLNIPNNYKVIFLQGGGTGQFAAVPLNLLVEGKTADYLVTGVWSKKAAQEAKKYGNVNIVFDMEKKDNFTSIPSESEWKLTDAQSAAYRYYCDNETINGVEFHDRPHVPDDGVPLVADMSSNFLSKPIDVSKYGLIYAGAQKNSGIAGVTVIIVREDLLNRSKSITPTVFDYKINAENKSLFNTPPTFSIYIAGLVYKWILEQGGVEVMQKQAAEKAKLLYEVLDGSEGFYRCPVQQTARSRMNVPFRIKGGDDKLEKTFVEEANKRGLIELAGHRSVGGIRASLYNAVSKKAVDALTDFMKEFKHTYL